MKPKLAQMLPLVSDNSASGQPLIGQSEAQREKFETGRRVIIPDLICRIAKED